MFKLKDKVKVLVNRSEGQPQWNLVHDGYVVGLTSHFVQVFNPKPEHDSICSPESAEFFPILGRRCKVLFF